MGKKPFHTFEDLYRLVSDVLRRHGLSDDQGAIIAQAIVSGERDGCDAHGLYRTLSCVEAMQRGQVDGQAQPEVHDHAPGIVRVDAKRGFSLLAFERGLPMLEQKAHVQGIAVMMINHCYHFSALWFELEKLTERGLVGLAMNPSHSWVAPAGGTNPVFGTNPIAFGWPRPGSPPYIFDFASSAIARGEIELHRRRGERLPAGVAIDARGQATQDPVAAISGAMLTFGGHKGSALATMIELLAGPLIGDLTSAESLDFDQGAQVVPYHGELILALDPEVFLGPAKDAHWSRAEKLFDPVRGKPRPSGRGRIARTA
ncbi:Ldh family oxidoreductase [Alcaligenaceae bacterium CGII-47]|nr:Ldh family oxidoreductase [Alcaligenaceae bacterium CGII-47]